MKVNDTKIDFLVRRDTYNVYLETNGGTIKESTDPTHEDDFLMSLANWGLSEERPEDLPEPSLSVNLMSSNYILNDGYVDDSGTYISVDTVAKITENLDKLSTVNFPWMIWGYDIDIPEYVKYRNGNDFVYVRSVQDVSSDWNVAGSIVDDFVGKEIFECSWNSESYKREYSAINTVKSVSDEEFTYGNNCTYSVPTKITDNDGKEYTFCGHTATLHSKNLVTSTNDNGTVMHRVMPFRYVNSSVGSNIYSKSLMRYYNNQRLGYSEYTPPEETTIHVGHWLASTNGLVTKFFGDVVFLKRITGQVNRVWNEQHPSEPDICIDEFGMIPCGEIGYLSAEFIPISCDTSIHSLYSSDQVDERRIKYGMSIDGKLSSFDDLSVGWWLRSSGATLPGFAQGCVGQRYIGTVADNRGGRAKGCSPLVLIG